ncbi:hypothetical protein Rsub_11672 [Raphidocelis subcapitata]|uniref:MutL C-terminal dimerisation domain-containing protein n=1 Tax=Raphidocelis subcapitata TaxID=307507 RepID=A0A2V0PFP7_9CHLO|nr:hypothetical protein Rsub_11672 [Raphidocelis subcapitata]|eukprot:GBF98678.1 hypothetical protein Rsub_11672 [Raphidocelis subcapitata]
MKSASAIAPLPPGLAAALGAAPQVPDAAAAISELVSNAVDAGARRVVVQLLALGPEDVAFAVEDDGAGIAPCSFAVLAQPGCTSKLRTTAQLEAGPCTLGFKGQALAALAAAADLEVVSRAAGGFETYAKRVRGGRVLGCGPAPAPRLRQGTRVGVAEFGLGTPVRRLQQLQAACSGALVRDVQRRLAALLLPWPEVALDLLDATTAASGGGADAWSGAASGACGGGGVAIMRLVQARPAADMFARLLWEAPADALLPVQAAAPAAHLEGCALAPGAACSASGQALLYVGRRLVRSAQLDALLDAWFVHAYAHHAGGDGATLLARSSRRVRPAYILQLSCPAGAVDVTTEPDKSVCLFRAWPAVAAVVMDALAPLWGPPPATLRAGLALGGAVSSGGRGGRSVGGGGASSNCSWQEASITAAQRHTVRGVLSDLKAAAARSSGSSEPGWMPQAKNSIASGSLQRRSACLPSGSGSGVVAPRCPEPGVGGAPAWHAQGAALFSGSGDQLWAKAPGACVDATAAAVLSVELLQRDASARGLGRLVPDTVQREHLEGAVFLQQVDSKAIIARCGPLLVALDQHAADERVQLEALQARIARESAAAQGVEGRGAGKHEGRGEGLVQTLPLQPAQALDLSASELQTLRAHRTRIAAWGWQLALPDAHGSGTDAAGTCAVALQRIPLVLGVPLGGLDLRLYLHQLAESGSGAGGAALPPGVARTARSKACRSAVKFNDPLTSAECRTLIQRLGATQMPFACAHGRPTTAPLLDLAALTAVLRAGRARRQPEEGAPRRLTVARLSKLARAEVVG